MVGFVVQAIHTVHPIDRHKYGRSATAEDYAKCEYGARYIRRLHSASILATFSTSKKIHLQAFYVEGVGLGEVGHPEIPIEAASTILSI